MIISDMPIYRSLEYFKYEQLLEYDRFHQTFRFVNSNEIPKQYVDRKTKIISDDIKVLIALHPRMFHLLIDNLAEIVYLNEYFMNKHKKKVTFVIETSDIVSHWFSDSSATYFSFFLKILNDINIDYIFIHSQQFHFPGTQVHPITKQEIYKNKYPNFNSLIEINNFYLWKPTGFKKHMFDLLSELFKKYNPNKNILNIKPTKTVYLTRIVPDNFKEKGSNNNDRGNNEKEIENFFKSMGCEIIAPEMFKTFEEQIEYFSSVKTLIGLTGSGLLNMLIMPNGGNVIELYTPISQNTFSSETLTTHFQTSLHHFYRDFAWVKDHTHVSIKNYHYLDDIEPSPSDNIFIDLKNNKILDLILKNDKI